MLTVKYNRSTNHIDGLTIRTTGGGRDMGDHVSDYSLNACASITRYRMADGPSFENVADALEVARALGGRNLCKNCEKAAEAMLASATPLPTAQNNEGENTMNERDTQVAEITANTERLVTLANEGNKDGFAELYETTEGLISALKGTGVKRLQMELRAPLHDAKTKINTAEAAPAVPGKEGTVTKRSEATTLETTDYKIIPGAVELIADKADLLAEGFKAHKAATTTARDAGSVLLQARTMFLDKNGVPALTGKCRAYTDWASDFFGKIGADLVTDEDYEALQKLKEASRYQADHLLRVYIRSLDENPEEYEKYGRILEINPELKDAKPSQVLFSYLDIDTKSRLERARDNRAQKALEAQRKQQAITAGSGEADSEGGDESDEAHAGTTQQERTMDRITKADTLLTEVEKTRKKLTAEERAAVKAKLDAHVSRAAALAALLAADAE